MVFDYKKLKRKILFVYGSCRAFAADIDKTPEWLSRRLTGKTPVSSDEIVIFAKKLDIDPSEFYDYFFTPKVR